MRVDVVQALAVADRPRQMTGPGHDLRMSSIVPAQMLSGRVMLLRVVGSVRGGRLLIGEFLHQ